MGHFKFNERVKQHNMVWWKISTGRRQTLQSWPRMLNSGRPRTIPDLIPATSGPHLNLPSQFSLHSTLPPPNFYFPSTLPFSYFSPISSPGKTHLLHLWRPFWARCKKTSRCGILSSLIWCFSVKNIKCKEKFTELFSLSNYQKTLACYYSRFTTLKAKNCIVARSSIQRTLNVDMVNSQPLKGIVIFYSTVSALNKNFSFHSNFDPYWFAIK